MGFFNNNVSVDVRKTTLAETKWFYDEQSGLIVNDRRAFFQIGGLQIGEIEQPIIIQNDIGFLGILCKPIDGVLHFLMQTKIEPGNVNKTQISPTIQATKSNFNRSHGGDRPAYVDWFLNSKRHRVIVDQIQSEQSSRFLGKRNRNIIVILDELAEVEVLPSHMWVTLGQIKSFMRIDNLVNMDSRTVISCIPFFKYHFDSCGTPLIRSILHGDQPDITQHIFSYICDYKMFNEDKPKLVPLRTLRNWESIIRDSIEEFVCKDAYPFKVAFFDISIEGREVGHWGQPLLEAQGISFIGLFTRVADGVQEFLVHAKAEVGCFDRIELGPTVQLEAMEEPESDIEKIFYERYAANQGVQYDVVLSDEGGRFYHSQNKNIIIEVEPDLIPLPPDGYWWCTYLTLNKLAQINNILNIQLRNLLSLLEIS